MNFLRFIILPDSHGEKIPALDGAIEESFYFYFFVVKLILLYSRFHPKYCVNYIEIFNQFLQLNFGSLYVRSIKINMV